MRTSVLLTTKNWKFFFLQAYEILLISILSQKKFFFLVCNCEFNGSFKLFSTSRHTHKYAQKMLGESRKKKLCNAEGSMNFHAYTLIFHQNVDYFWETHNFFYSAPLEKKNIKLHSRNKERSECRLRIRTSI